MVAEWLKNKKAKLLAGVFCAAVLSVSAFSLQPAYAAAEDSKVVDDADLLSYDEEQEIQSMLDEFAEESGWTLFAVTTDDANGMTSEEYADDYVDQNAFEENGVCFLIDMDNREIYMSTTGSAIRILTDHRIDSIMDDSYEYAGDGEYAKCFETMIRETEDSFHEGIESGQYNYDRDTGEISKAPNRLTVWDMLISLIAAAAAGGAVIAVIAGKYRLKFGGWQYDFKSNSKLDLTNKTDRLVNEFRTAHHIQRDSGGSSHSSGSRSTTHHSSGGGTHGGGGHKF